MKPLLELSNVSKIYGLGPASVNALKSISLTITDGEFTAFVGSSGSGKTTLLNLIGGLDVPSSGHILFQGENMAQLSSRALADLRRHKMGFIFQTFNLLPVLTGLENVEYPLLRIGISSDELKKRSQDAIARVGLTSVMHHRPNQMSGGQRQRIAIARAIVHRPQVVLADEPTANLDKKTASDIISLMKSLNQEDKVTFIFSTHDPMIMEAATRVVPISDGSVTPVFQGR